MRAVGRLAANQNALKRPAIRHKTETQRLFRRSRLWLALWYALVMGGILSLSALVMYRGLMQSRWGALEQEIEATAGTLHDSLEPMLPTAAAPAAALQQIFPDLCLANQPCEVSPTLIERHTTGVSDRTTYYVRLFDHDGNLLAFSYNQPALSEALDPALWQTLQVGDGPRYQQFTTVLHNAPHQQGQQQGQQQAPRPAHRHARGEALHTHPATHPASWGYLQVGRTLAGFDAETQRIRWAIALGLPLALGLVGISSWGLSGLAMQPIYRSYQQQQQFTANAAHELRSPLANLLATVEATLRLSPDQQQDIAPSLQTIERQGRRLSQLITDLLLLTSLEQAASPSLFKPCCLNDLIADLTEEYQELATLADIDLTCQLPTAEVYVWGNESQLYRLVANLIDNGIRYTGARGAVTIKLHELEQRDRTVAVTVQDTGIGIPAPEQARIFERFYRLDSGRDRKTGGTGLGLAIAQEIIRSHKGSLTVKSIVGQGSLFTVQFSNPRYC